jgi:ubiquitin carboxyl-terminal hydrolase 8
VHNRFEKMTAAAMNGVSYIDVATSKNDSQPSYPVMAALAALSPLTVGQTVYLMDPSWLQHWLNWAWSLHPADSLQRLALQWNLTISPFDVEGPGPIDSSCLGSHADVTILDPSINSFVSGSIPRVRSDVTTKEEKKQDEMNASGQVIAVSEEFYEHLRRVHGVICNDGYTVSFQRQEREILLLYEPLESPRPIEYKRKVIWGTPHTAHPGPHMSLMEKLMLQEDRPTRVPVVELHPPKLEYSLTRIDFNSGASNHLEVGEGIVYVSSATPLSDTMSAVLKIATPNTASQNVRLWTEMNYAFSGETGLPVDGDGFELLDLDDKSRTVSDLQSTKLLIETRCSVNLPWTRRSLIDRLKVGDFVDAQDIAGQWYEAVVREIGEDTVKVHYLGWHSKWDGLVPKYKTETKGPAPPAPLWSRTKRWREKLKVGDAVEIRDSSSIVNRPKWYSGIVKQIGKPTDRARVIDGGADLEDSNLLLLHRTQQVLVEVEQEKTDKATMSTAPMSPTTADPPFRRWVNLYGEEICALHTHLNEKVANEPATLQYDLGYGRDKPVEVLKGHGAGFLRESLRGSPPAPGSVGLQNLGNSCFLNSILQCLNHIQPLTQYFLKDHYLQDINKSNPLGSCGQVSEAYAGLLQKVWSGEYSILAPRLLKQTVASFAPQFDNSYQHDSQEFCQFLLDGLHEDLNRVKKKPYVEELEGFGRPDHETAIESWRKHLLRHDSVIVDYCQGMHRSHLTCPHCGRESIKFDVYSSISLPLVMHKDKMSTLSLEDCLEKFMEGEQLDDLNAWFCPRCRKHVCALKLIALWSVPDILILHLKRFTFDTCLTSGTMLRSKIDCKVEFPIDNLDLTKHVLGPIDPDAPPIYSLFGVSEHTGPTANSGHYTATVRNSVNGNWYRYNDSHVGRTSGEASVTGGAYVLFYQRTKGISKWGGMDKVIREKCIDPYNELETDQEGFTKVKSKKKSNK